MGVQTLVAFVRQSTRDLQRFARHSRKQRQCPTGGSGLLRSLPYFSAWRKSLQGSSPLDDGVPWITFPAIRLLQRTLRPGMRVFEYGSGGSTLCFARRGATVISIEHNPEWYGRVVSRLEQEHQHNASVTLVEPVPTTHTSDADPADPEVYISSAPEYHHYDFKNYVTTIDAYPDDHFDLILIDGRARPACIRHARSKVRIGGHVVLDNSDLPHYSPATLLLDDVYRRMDCPGPIPYLQTFIRTTAWRRLK